MCQAHNRCSEKAIRYLQTASMVVEKGGESRTINSCQQCYNEKVGAARQTATEIVAMERGSGEEGAPWKAMEGIWE